MFGGRRRKEVEDARKEADSLRGELAHALERIKFLEKRQYAGPRPHADKVVWIFGSGRSGNTWLSSMMGELKGHAVWREPSVGRLFGEFYYLHSRPGQLGTHNYILGERQRKTWLRSIREFVLENAGGRFPELADGFLVVKEHVGSIGAPLLVEALPESRVILLLRDPRDAVASALDGTREGGWRRGGLADDDRSRVLADEDPAAFVEENARQHLLAVSKGKEAYDAHRGPKVLIRYEELNADALGTMRRLYSELGIRVGDKELVRAVEKHSWENIPEDKTGRGKFYRKASPGGWREDLTPEQVEAIERITAPLIEELYS